MSTIAADPQLRSLAIRIVFGSADGISAMSFAGHESMQIIDSTPTLDDVIETFLLLDHVYAFANDPRSIEIAGIGKALSVPPMLRHMQLRLYRISMNSPLELLAGIPPTLMAVAGSGGLLTFLSFFERVFNLPLVIQVGRDRLLAEGQGYKADLLEQELRTLECEEKLDALRQRANELKLVPKEATVLEFDEVIGSAKQQEDALRRAHDIRQRRAELKKKLRSGEVSIQQVLLDPPDYVLTAKVFDLLLAVPRYGRIKTNRILTQCQITPSKTIGGLSERQRAELASLLG